jgi:hypothetical protein
LSNTFGGQSAARPRLAQPSGRPRPGPAPGRLESVPRLPAGRPTPQAGASRSPIPPVLVTGPGTAPPAS